MCRYVAYLGQPLRLADLVYKPVNSLIHQAVAAMESPTRINADGFGIGWYNPALDPAPAVFKDISPAWNNANLRSLADKISSGCIIAHVRAAQRHDPISRANCHPFQYGTLLWMHNGDIPGRGRLHRRVVSEADDSLVARLKGNTDSELAFALFLSQLGDARHEICTAPMLARAMRCTIERIHGWWREDCDERVLALNFSVTNGRSLVASRFGRGEHPPSLHYCVGSRYRCEEGACRMERPDDTDGCVLVASERLSADPHWETIGEDQMVVVRSNLDVELQALEPVHV